MKKVVYLVLIIIMIPFMVNAKEITSECKITIDSMQNKKIKDNNYNTYISEDKNDYIIVECPTDIKYLYIKYHNHAVKGRILFENYENVLGANNYLHELVKINNNVNSFKVVYEEKYEIADIYLYDDENLPKEIQNWQTLDTADLMLFSTHADDEHLFFAGLLPKYVDAGKKVQVVYFTRHLNNVLRYHELLDGLWAAGIKYYPLVSDFPDEYSTTKDGALLNFERVGYTIDDLIKFQVNAIRKYKPYVVVGHDENGEYSHGQHILNTFILKTAYSKANEIDYDPESAEQYGIWNIQKLYLHLYEQNKLCLNYDEPLTSFEGKTAFQVSQEAFAYHISQQYTWFREWLYGTNNNITSYTQIKTYNPCEFGLYYTNVGEDELKTDLFEHINDTKNNPINEDKEEEKQQNIEIESEQKIETNSNIMLYVLIGVVIVIIIILLISIIIKR